MIYMGNKIPDKSPIYEIMNFYFLNIFLTNQYFSILFFSRNVCEKFSTRVLNWFEQKMCSNKEKNVLKLHGKTFYFCKDIFKISIKY